MAATLVISGLPRLAVSTLQALLPAQVVSHNALVADAGYQLPAVASEQIAYWAQPDHYPTGELRVRVSMVDGDIARRSASRRYTGKMILQVACEVPADVLTIDPAGMLPTPEAACGYAAWDLAQCCWAVLMQKGGVLDLADVLEESGTQGLQDIHDFQDNTTEAEDDRDVDVTASRVVLTIGLNLNLAVAQ